MVGPSSVAEVDLSLFEQEGFDAREFIIQHRRRVPLAQLQKVLTGHYDHVKSELVAVINEKYSEFVSLSTKMKQLEQLSAPIMDPLKDNRNICDNFTERLDEVCQKAREGIMKRKKIADKKRTILGLQEYSKLLSKMKVALPPLISTETACMDDVLKNYGTLDFVASRVRRIRLFLLLNPGEDELKGIVDQLRTDLDSFEELATENLFGSLRATFQGIQENSASRSSNADSGDSKEDMEAYSVAQLMAFKYLARACHLLNAEPDCERIFTETFISGIIENAKKKMSSSMVDYFRTLEESIFSPDSPILSVAESCPELCLLSRSVARPIVQHLVSECSSVFIPTGMLEVFAENYVAFCSLRKRLEYHMTPEERKQWKPEQESVNKKWQIHVYFSIREKDLACYYSNAVTECKQFYPHDVVGGQEVIGGSQSSTAKFKLPSTEALFSQMSKIWSREKTVYLDGLFTRFLSLSVKFLHSYLSEIPKDFLQHQLAKSSNTLNEREGTQTWVGGDLEKHGILFVSDLYLIVHHLDFGNAVENLVLHGETNAVDETEIDDLEDLEQIIYKLECAGATDGGKPSITFSCDREKSAIAGILLEESLRAVKDVDLSDVSKQQGDGQVAETAVPNSEVQVLKATAKSKFQMVKTVDHLFDDTRHEIGNTIEKITSLLLGKIQDKISVDLYENVKRIPSLYRMMNKPAPTKALPYVATLFKPLDELVSLSRVRVVESNCLPISTVDEIFLTWEQKVVQDTAFGFEKVAEQIAEQVEASYRSLQRVASVAATGEDDVQKILLQLKLDIGEFLNICRTKYKLHNIVISVKKLDG